jgi:hypothetical protein
MRKQTILEAKLTTRELELKNKLYSQYKKNKRKFVKDYGGNAEQVMVGRAIKLAKNMAEKENKQKIKEMIKKSLSQGVKEEINAVDYIQNRQPVKSEENPTDTVTLDIPLLIRVMEYAKEDAKTDMDLHAAAENMIQLAKDNRILNMDDYDKIIIPDDPINELVTKVVKKLKSK